MTRQEIFNTVARHLFTQRERSMHWSMTSCLYRGLTGAHKNGASCAICCLIPDDWYSPDMEGYTVSELIVRGFKLPPMFDGKNSFFLRTLQKVHDEKDNWSSSERMRNALRRIAKNFELSADIVDTLSFVD